MISGTEQRVLELHRETNCCEIGKWQGYVGWENVMKATYANATGYFFLQTSATRLQVPIISDFQNQLPSGI